MSFGEVNKKNSLKKKKKDLSHTTNTKILFQLVSINKYLGKQKILKNQNNFLVITLKLCFHPVNIKNKHSIISFKYFL